MDTTDQVQVGAPANPEPQVQDAQVQQPTNSTLPPDAQRFVVEPPATPPTDDSQGQAQGQVTQQPQQNGQSDVADFQRKLNERQVQLYQAQQEIERLKQQQQAPVQSQEERNPYDPNSDWFNAIKWEQQKAAREAAKLAAEQALTGVYQFAQQQSQRQQEVQWQQAHPNVDINLVKQWGQMNGVTNLDHAYTLMTLPNTLQSAQAQAANTAFNQFKQPQNVATPVRGGQQAGGVTQLDFQKMEAEYQATYGNPPWDPRLKEAFENYAMRRESAMRGR